MLPKTRLFRHCLDFDYREEERVFLKTFSVLKETLGPHSFSYPNRTRDDLTMGFSVYHFEALTIGLQAHLDEIDLDDQDLLDEIKEELKSIKLDDDFIDITTGGGKNSPGPLNNRIGFVEGRVGGLI